MTKSSWKLGRIMEVRELLSAYDFPGDGPSDQIIGFRA